MTPPAAAAPIREGRTSVTDVASRVKQAFAQRYQEDLRTELNQRSKAWLVDQLVAMISRPEGSAPPRLETLMREAAVEEKRSTERTARVERLRALRIDEKRLGRVVANWNSVTRERLEEQGYLISPPALGGEAIRARQRSAKGEKLLTRAKDVLYAVLYGGQNEGVRFDRVEQELLTLTVPGGKASAFSFLKAVTELNGHGSWRDPGSAAHDERAENVLLQVEYGELASELIGDAVLASLRLINWLEINEVVLYCRMANVEQSSLVE